MAGGASLRMVPGNMDRMCLSGLEVEEMGQNGVTLGLSSVVVGKGRWAWEHHFPMLSNLLLLQGWPVFLWSPIHLFSYRSRQRLRKLTAADKASYRAQRRRRRKRKLGQSPDVMGFRESDICGFLRAWKFHCPWLRHEEPASWGLVHDHPGAPSRVNRIHVSASRP